LTLSNEATAETEEVLNIGQRHAATLLASNPRSSPARYVAAFLNLRLGQLYGRTERIDEAVGLVQQATNEAETLLAANPRPMWIYDHDTLAILGRLLGVSAIKLALGLRQLAKVFFGQL
jgi:hypothetical protein